MSSVEMLTVVEIKQQYVALEKKEMKRIVMRIFWIYSFF